MTPVFDNSYFKDGAEKQLELFYILDFRVFQALEHHFRKRALQQQVEFFCSVVTQWLSCCRTRLFVSAENQLIQAAAQMLGDAYSNCQTYACFTIFQITHMGLGNINSFCQALLDTCDLVRICLILLPISL